MSARGPLLATAVLATAAAVLIWLALRSEPEEAAVTEAPRAAETKATAGPATAQPPAETQPPPGGAQEVLPGRAETREAVGRRARWSAPLRGRIEDQRTGEPVPHALVTTRLFTEREQLLSTTDERGEFETPRSLGPKHLRVEVRDAFSETPIARRGVLHHSHASPFVMPTPIGPTYRLEVHGGAPGEEWEAMLVEVDPYGGERCWPALTLRPHPDGAGPWIRYGKVHHEPDGRRKPKLRVVNGDQTWMGETQVQATVGVHPGTVAVVVAPRAGAIAGRVSNPSGEPIDAHVRLLVHHPEYRDEEAWREERTVEGRFRFEGVPAGVHRVMAGTNAHGVASARVEAVAGRTTEQDLVVPDVAIAGDLRGALVGPPGEEPLALVTLESTDGGSVRRLAFAGFRIGGYCGSAPRRDDGRSSFWFTSLPEGTFRVSISPLDGRRYDRTAANTSVPATEILFRTDDRGRQYVSYAIAVRDARSGERVRSVSTLMRLGSLWAAPVAEDSGLLVDGGSDSIDLCWVVAAPGYRPALASLADARRDGDTLRMDVALEPGHGAALVVVDAESPIGGSEVSLIDFLPWQSLRGVEILVNSRAVGRSDASGLALVDTSAPIEQFGVRAPGWAVLVKQRFRNHAETPDGIGFVLMARE